MWRLVVLGAVALTVMILGFSLVEVGGGEVNASAVVEVRAGDTSGYTRAIDPRDWQFPRDFGAHADYQTEWWYYTGNLTAEDGRRFGYQFTVFRRAVLPPDEAAETESEWRSAQVYMAHFTLSDIEGERFYHDQRYSRGGADLAGALPDNAAPDAAYRVWLEDWQVMALDESADTLLITAASQVDGAPFAVDLTLEAAKAPALQGDNGLSQKSEDLANASYYYSRSRLITEGTIHVGGETFSVSGRTWMDHEFSTSALGPDAEGWDWFGLHLDNGVDLVVGQIRLIGGGARTSYTGTVVYEDGSTYHLSPEDYSIEATGTWESPHTGAVYPAGWLVTITAEAARMEDDLVIELTPLLADQELHGGDIAYWEGAVAITGDVTGSGYAELTGYVDTLTGRF
jgi:predicted secreted hydrolase